MRLQPNLHHLAVSILAVAWALPVASVRAAELHVDPIAGNDQSGNGSPAAPYRSLTRALAVARSGDTVRARPGLYSPVTGEQFPLNLVAGVAVAGAGRGKSFLAGVPSPVAVRATGSLPSTTTFTGFTLRSFEIGVEVLSAAVQARFADLRFEGGQVGVRHAAAGAGVSAPRFERCLFFGQAAHGVRIDGVTANTVRPVLVNCVFHGAAASGLVLIPQAAGSVLVPVVSHGTFCRNGLRGLEVRAGAGSAMPEVYNSILTGHTTDLDGIDPSRTGNNLLGRSLLIGLRGNFSGDPRFVAETGGDLHLLCGSAATDRADPALPEATAADLDGQPRALLRDVGADEHVDATFYPRDDAGAHPGLPLWCRHVDVPGNAVTCFLSYGTVSPGFPVPGLRGELQLDVGLLLLPVFFALVDQTGYVDGPLPVPDDASLAGLTVFLQSVGVGYGMQVSGAWSNVLAPTILQR